MSASSAWRAVDDNDDERATYTKYAFACVWRCFVVRATRHTIRLAEMCMHLKTRPCWAHITTANEDDELLLCSLVRFGWKDPRPG